MKYFLCVLSLLSALIVMRVDCESWRVYAGTIILAIAYYILYKTPGRKSNGQNS